jgi:quinol monooxygenase YgiN
LRLGLRLNKIFNHQKRFIMKKIIARLFIKEGSIDAFKAHAALIIPKTRREKGCIFYSLFEDVCKPGEFLFYEEYADQAAVDLHLGSEYLKTFRASVEHMHAKDKIVEII